jgi:Family of unknown function (DUF6325)
LDPSNARELTDAPTDVAPDLVEYLIVAVPDRASLAHLVPALTELVGAAVIRILDLAVVVRDVDGAVDVLEVETVESLGGLGAVEGQVGSLLSDHDLELASFALPPGSAGIVLVTEDRWAEPLSAAARRAGGHIIAGERIPRTRVEAVLAEPTDDDRTGG